MRYAAALLLAGLGAACTSGAPARSCNPSYVTPDGAVPEGGLTAAECAAFCGSGGGGSCQVVMMGTEVQIECIPLCL
jgi:hypothetical protein